MTVSVVTAMSLRQPIERFANSRVPATFPRAAVWGTSKSPDKAEGQTKEAGMKCRQRHDDVVKTSRIIAPRGTTLGRISGLAVAAMSALALLAAPAAQASTITVGSVLPPGSVPTEFEQVRTLFNTALPEKGANLASPVNGTIVRWRMQDPEGGPFRLRVLRPNGSGAYTAVGTSNPATPAAGGGLQTFTANLPVRAGDLIGVDPANGTDKVAVAEAAGASYGFIFPPPFDAATVAPSGTVAGKEILLSAEVQPAPAITAIDPFFGSVAGGTSVTITGTDLGAASAVKFGSVPATGFTVDSETQITAIAPPSAKTGTVDVTVTTLAGTSPAVREARFLYEGCVVPKLKGKSLKSSKRALRRNECKVGTIMRRKGKASKVGKVVKQSAKPGKVLPPKTKVNLTVGK
jgi:IPT/TIG domain/PASTA domain